MLKNNLMKLFRPWDSVNVNVSVSVNDNEQDATISTTTSSNQEQEDCPRLKEEEVEKEETIKQKCKTKTKTNAKEKSIKEIQVSKSEMNVDERYLLCQGVVDPYSSICPNLGLNGCDGLLFESMVQGYSAMEEYARILSHEQHVKMMSGKKQRPKKYKCPHCEVGFSNNGQLKGHIRIHTGERPYRCDAPECGKTFTRNEELTRHKRIHSGLRPFPCSQCGKRFGRKDHLKKHSRTHVPQPRGANLDGAFAMYAAVPLMLTPMDPVWTATATQQQHVNSYPFLMPAIY